MISASLQLYSGHKTKQDERAGHITNVGEKRCVLGFGAEPPETKGELGRPSRSREDKMKLKKRD
jgi:hypothetical protein